jgi:hypothetical protein
MKWFKKWFRNQCVEAWNSEKEYTTFSNNGLNVIRSTESNLNMDNGLRFSVLSALGGTIVEIRHYDQKTDRNRNIVHVIPDGEDISVRIGQIVSMELLRG